MTETPRPTLANATTTGMKGKGFYNKHSAPQYASIAHVLPWLQGAAGDLPQTDSHIPLRFADFGCSEGANSIKVMACLQQAIRQNHANPIQTIHSDLPSNDYTSLLHAIAERTQLPYSDSSVFGSIVGGSMFSQLLPPRSTHLATSFNAVGFFSKRPLERLPDYSLPNGPDPDVKRGSVSAEDHAICEQQAKLDLENFLKARAQELAPGGKLLLQSFGRSATVAVSKGVFKAFNGALMDHVDSGELPRDIYERYYHPVYLRNIEQLTAPVQPETGPLAYLFKLEKSECYEAPAPFVEQFKQDQNAAVYAHQMTRFFRAFTEATLRAALMETGRASQLIESIYTRAENLIKQAPKDYQFHNISVAMLLTRTDAQ